MPLEKEKPPQSRSAAASATETGKPGASSPGQEEKKPGRRAISESSKSRVSGDKEKEISAPTEDSGAPVSGKGRTSASSAREEKGEAVNETPEPGKVRGERTVEARENSPREADVPDSGSADAGEAARGEVGGKTKRTPGRRSRPRTARSKGSATVGPDNTASPEALPNPESVEKPRRLPAAGKGAAGVGASSPEGGITSPAVPALPIEKVVVVDIPEKKEK